MKRMLCVILGMLLAAVMLGGCGSVELDADESVVYVNKKGEITFLDVAPFDQGLYDEGELRSFLEDEIGAYTDEHGSGTVRLVDLAVENGTAKLWISCQSADDFAQYNGIELYQGRVVDALAAGYVFDGDFVKVEGGAAAGEATKQEIYQDNELKVVILRSELDVQVEGEICYVSCQNVSITGSDSVSVRSGIYLGEQTTPVVSPSAGNQSVGETDGTEAVGDTEDADPDGDGAEDDEDETEGSVPETEEDDEDAGMVIDGDTSGESAAGVGAYDFYGDAPQEEAADVYVFIVYR